MAKIIVRVPLAGWVDVEVDISGIKIENKDGRPRGDTEALEKMSMEKAYEFLGNVDWCSENEYMVDALSHICQGNVLYADQSEIEVIDWDSDDD